MLMEMLRENRDRIADRWLDSILSTYPPDSIDFFKNQRNRFSNPIGATFRRELPLIVSELTGDMNEQIMRESVGVLMRIRAVQEFTKDEALGFVLKLKEIVRSIASDSQRDDATFTDIDSRTDRLYGIAVEAYSECREVIQRIRDREATMNTFSPVGRRAFGTEAMADNDATNTEDNPSVNRHEGSGR